METPYETKIDRFGRVLIPKELREDLGLSPGSVLTIEQRGKEIALYPLSEEPTLVHKGEVLVARVEAKQDLSGIEKKLRSDRLGALLRRSGK
jgi:AbrB family looped-hinge helix DNA binding protein